MVDNLPVPNVKMEENSVSATV